MGLYKIHLTVLVVADHDDQAAALAEILRAELEAEPCARRADAEALEFVSIREDAGARDA